MKPRYQRLNKYLAQAIDDGVLPEDFFPEQVAALIYKDIEVACERKHK